MLLHVCNRCNMGTRDLPDMYARSPRDAGLRAYISGKSRVYPYSPSHLVYTSVHDQKADQRVQRKDFPGIQLDVHRCTSSCIPGKSFL